MKASARAAQLLKSTGRDVLTAQAGYSPALWAINSGAASVMGR